MDEDDVEGVVEPLYDTPQPEGVATDLRKLVHSITVLAVQETKITAEDLAALLVSELGQKVTQPLRGAWSPSTTVPLSHCASQHLERLSHGKLPALLPSRRVIHISHAATDQSQTMLSDIKFTKPSSYQSRMSTRTHTLLTTTMHPTPILWTTLGRTPT